jgi:hypothetical protein
MIAQHNLLVVNLFGLICSNNITICKAVTTWCQWLNSLLYGSYQYHLLCTVDENHSFT